MPEYWCEFEFEISDESGQTLARGSCEGTFDAPDDETAKRMVDGARLGPSVDWKLARMGADEVWDG